MPFCARLGAPCSPTWGARIFDKRRTDAPRDTGRDHAYGQLIEISANTPVALGLATCSSKLSSTPQGYQRRNDAFIVRAPTCVLRR